MTQTITLQVPDSLYQRLLRTAQATHQSLEAIMLRVLEVGSPPDVLDVPEVVRADLVVLDGLDNGALWQIAYGNEASTMVRGLEAKLEQDGPATDPMELLRLQEEIDLAVLRKSHAAAILRWRGCVVPLP